MKCKTCGVPMAETWLEFEGSESAGVYYPQCDCIEDDENGADVEVEPDWFITVDIPDSLSVTQLKAIREVDEHFRTLSIVACKALLQSQNEITIGPFYWKDKVDNAAGMLASVKLSVRIS
ncbi:hypothetical protein O5O45_15700 [Hahella aquimaris]|uniref:hypothetical protein n=1 Tax=Hahella sp. HNIBRBA332 TaxID=3015983 RepID=UPI00273CC22F|nr:hypothetical protein [Hahella sp. HNIBRBA332]WLQ17357.1 hypothetical protein O5O45_15700 [Hahella sp. HNIBRBA332]